MVETLSTQYSTKDHSSEDMLYNYKILSPVELTSAITYLNGRNSNKYPLLFNAISGNKSNGGLKSMSPTVLGDTQYYVNTFGKIKRTTQILGLVDTTLTKPGVGISTFEIYLSDNWAHNQQKLTSPDGQYQLRIQNEPVRAGTNRYRAKVSMYTTSYTDFVPVANFASGKHWTIGAAQVPTSESIGTASNSQSTGRMINQFGFVRFSKKIAGNISNKVVNVTLPIFNEAGMQTGTTRSWMPFEMNMWENESRIQEEESLIESIYNRDINGVITTVDENTDLRVPTGAGVKQILKAGGRYDSYGVGLSLTKLRHTILSGTTTGSFDGVKEVVLYTGSGGNELFQNAVAADASSNSYFQSVGSDFIKANADGLLDYGNYFNRWKTPEGIILTVVVSDHFDMGGRAQADRLNGRMYNGYPLYSYNFMALDHSTSSESGERNIIVVAEQGREVIHKIIPGMSPLPEAYRAAESMIAATSRDVASIEIMKSQGIQISDVSRSFWLEMVA